MPKFAHLHVHSHYSLLDGLGKIEPLLKRAKEMEMEALALTDHGNLYGAIEFYKTAKKIGIKPILGVEAYVAPNSHLSKQPRIDDKRYHLTLLVKDQIGWKNLMKLMTIAHLDGFYYKPRIDKQLLEQYHEGLICLSGCHSGELLQLIKAGKYDDAKKLAEWYRSVFADDFYLEIQKHNLEFKEQLVKLSKETGIPLVATHDVHYINHEDQTAHEVLLAIQTNSKLDDTDRLTLKNYDLSLQSPEDMAKIFADLPEALSNTAVIAAKCNLEIELGKNHIPKFDVPEPGLTAFQYLKKLIEERIDNRYPQMTPEIQSRLENELSVIEQTQFADYFLIVQDFINWAKERKIVVGPGRGSAAGSIIAYILNITDIDPLKYDLIFERFLNPERIQVPDIDTDFTDIRRDEVVAYVREKYGEDRVAQIITFGTMAARAAIRDTTRALGQPYSAGDQIAKLIPFNTSLGEALKTVDELKQLYGRNADVKKIIDNAIKLEGTARHSSVHACGLVIAPEPLTNFLPLQRAPGETQIITQFEMHSVEDIGILKMDMLGLKNLTIIEKTLRLIKENKGEDIDIKKIPLDDPAAFKPFQLGETTGIFQFESQGMRRYLKELKPTELEDIIAMVSLYRPGPMDLIPTYINRKFGKETVSYLHPRLKPILEKTYGIGIYQEQMMRIARDLAGFSLPEADTLRKAIGKKIQKLLDEQQEKLISGMIKNGIAPKTAEKIWELFPPFARYGFNRSHAACYATISYETAWLKSHYPVELTTSLLNIAGGDVERINFIVNEGKRLDIKVLAPDINSSFQNFTVENENIRFGLLAIKNVGLNIVDFIIEERGRGGPFADIADFLTRINHRDLNKKSLDSLIKAGVFDSFDLKRGQLIANIENLIRFNQASRKDSSSSQSNLFGSSSSLVSLRLEPAEPIDKNTMLAWEKDLIGLYITDHPFNAYAAKLKTLVKPIKEIIEISDHNEIKVRAAGIVSSIQKIITKKGSPMLFVKIEDLSGEIEILVFTSVLENNPDIWQVGKAIMLEGRLSWKDNEPKILCDQAKSL